MAKTNLASMSVDALLKLRDDIEKALSRKATQLQDQLSRLPATARWFVAAPEFGRDWRCGAPTPPEDFAHNFEMAK